MSEFLAEAQVLVTPNTAGFRASLEKQLAAATKGVTVPVSIIAAGGGLAGVTAATASLAAAQKLAATGTLDLISDQQILGSVYGKNAVILDALTGATVEQAGAQELLDRVNKKSAASLLGFGSASDKLSAGLLGLRTAIGSSAVIGLSALALGAIAAGKAVSASVQNFAEFQQELATFRVIAGATADEMRAVSEQAQALGADVRLPAVSAADAAVAMAELAKAGLTVQEAMAGAEGVLQLATAAQISNAEAAQITANALNSFGLAGDEAVRVADDLANAANAAQGSISDFGLALRQSAAVARQVGLSLEDTTAILSLFAKNGLSGSDAGTSLRVALIRLVAPTEKAAEVIKDLGLQIRDAQGNVRPDVFAQFGQATANLTPAARDAAAALLFGQDAIRAVSIGAREGATGLQLMQFEIDKTGTAADVAAARTEGLAGSFSALQSSLETLSVNFGGLISGPLGIFVDELNGVATVANRAAEQIRKLANAKIPPIKITFGITFPGGKVGDFLKTALGLGGVTEFKFLLRTAFPPGELEKRRKEILEELQGLQAARIPALEGGASPDKIQEITRRIKELKGELKALELQGQGLTPGLVAPLEKSIAVLEQLDQTPFIEKLIRNLRAEIPIAQEVSRENAAMARGMDGVSFSAQGAATSVDTMTQALKGLSQQASQAQAELLRLQTEGGTSAQQVGALQTDIQAQRDIIRILKENGNQPGDATAIEKARNQIKSDQSQIDSIQAGIVADQKAAAAEAKTKAKEAQEARDDQFEALADMFGARQENIENAIARAGINDNVSNQLKFNKALIASLKKEIEVLKERFKNIKVSAAVRKAIFDAIKKELAQARQDRLKFQQDLQDQLLERADLRIRIAQARDNVAAELKARKARLDIITAQLARLKNAGKKNTLAWLELKAQQAEEIAAIKELQGQTKEKNQAGKSFFFEFLQTQQGFAANLLGNLIPGFATKGLVGGSGDTGDAGEGLRQVAGGFEQPRGAASTSAALASSRDRGVRPVQVDTTNAILRKILASINNLEGRAQSPEARYQKNVSGGAMDTL